MEVLVPEDTDRLLAAAAAARRDADVISAAAVTERRALAHRMAAHGYGVSDIAVLLGVSLARAQLLVRDEAADPHRARQQHSGYQHEAFFYDSDQDFLAGTVPFVQDAIALGQPVLVALAGPRLRTVQAALAPAGGEVRFVDLAELGANPARIIPAWLDFVERYAGRPVRGIGEPQWPGRRPEEVLECQLHEGLLNLAVGPDVPLWLRCPYDRARLPAPVTEAARHSHPALVEVGSYRGSTSYGGLHHVDSLFRSALPPAPAGCPVHPFSGPDLPAVRALVERSAQEAGLDAGAARALTAAVAELAANSVRHGGGGGELRTWTRPDALVVEVSDAGTLDDLMAGRRTPTLDDESARGFWLAHQLADLVQVRATARGRTARVLTWR